jgi:hypothetical protein
VNGHGHIMAKSLSINLQPHRASCFFGSDLCPGRYILDLDHANSVTTFGETRCLGVYLAVARNTSIPADVCAAIRGEIGETCCTTVSFPPTAAPVVVDGGATIAPDKNTATVPPDKNTATVAPNSSAASPGFPVLTIGMMLAGTSSFLAVLN